MINVSELLRKTYFFSNLDNSILDQISRKVIFHNFPLGTYIFREGEEATNFYTLIEGTIGIYKTSNDGTQNLLSQQSSIHVFGEMALVDDLPRSATVIAETDIKVLSIDRNDFIELLHDHKSLLYSVIQSLASMIRKSNESYVDDLSKRNKELLQKNEELEKAQEELIRAERFSNLGKLISLIIHDIKNPLSAIRGYSELIQFQSQPSDQIYSYSKKILYESDRLYNSLQELLDYTKGDMRLKFSPLTLIELQRFIQNEYEDHCKKKNISFLVSLHDDFTDPIMADSNRLQRAISNLIDNALNALNKEYSTLEVYLLRNCSSHFSVRVKDNGIGIEKQYINKIFEPFFSISKHHGTGLGMVSVKNIVEAHKGTIVIDSQLGIGTNVLVTIPCNMEIIEQNFG
jgi:signal transduction histidine kinase